MERLITSQVLGQLIYQYVDSFAVGGRDCRVLVPGLTKKIAREVHYYLLSQGVNSYLIIGTEEDPSETDHLIRAVGLTSKRIGSFVAIADPGQMAHIQDSIRGSGGAIRFQAFSEEWPWIDSGSEFFRFDGPVLSEIVKRWTADDEERKWLYELVSQGLIDHTRASSRREQILLEEILGSFDPNLYPVIIGVKQKFLYHAGIPGPQETFSDVTNLIRRTASLCQKIVGRCQNEDQLRQQVKDRVMDVVSEGEQEGVRYALDCFLDGIGRSNTLDLGVIAFYSCWGEDKNDPSHWQRLSLELLGELFDVKSREKSEVTYKIKCKRGIIGGKGRKIATFIGEEIILDVTYRIPRSQFVAGNWAVRILNRQRIVKEQVLNEYEGSFTLQLDTASIARSYTRKIPLRIAVVYGNEVDSYARLELHLCGEDRPAFVVADPPFDVVDAAESDEEETPDRKLTVEDPLHLFLFSHGDREISTRDENSNEINIIKTEMAGVWRTAQRVDPSAEPSGIVIEATFGSLVAVLCFEAKDLERGKFTLEDEFRIAISGGRENRFKHLHSLFLGENVEPYPALGEMDETARRRISLANYMTCRTGWRPIITDLLIEKSYSLGSLGDYVNHAGPVDGEAFKALTLPEEPLSLLKSYYENRELVLREVESFPYQDSSNIEHPIYASHPVFTQKGAKRMEMLLSNFLDAYWDILYFISDSQNDLEWSQLFVLAHLDCVVHWDNTHLRNAFFLLGPWHPLILAKRFMVQSALFQRASRVFDEQGGKDFRRLSFLLGGVEGFRWVLALSADDRSVEPAYVKPTSDPGWHFAMNTKAPSLAAIEEVRSVSGIAQVLRRNVGLGIMTGLGGDSNLAVTCLDNHVRAFPSKRSIGMRISGGYNGKDILKGVDAYIHDEDGATESGKQLPGGVRLCFQERPDETGGARWTDPPLYSYIFREDAECFQATQPDIYILPPVDELSFKTSTTSYQLPRGQANNAVFSKGLCWLTEGHTQVPKSIKFDYDFPREGQGGIGEAFTKVVGQIGYMLGSPVTAICEAALPQRLSSPWVVVPGYSIDPAILVKYVRDGADRDIQERALWDYKFDVTGRVNSYFVLSTVPRNFHVAVNGFFEGKDIASDFISELGRIGIAIGGEALKSGRRALGVVGLIGAVRLLVGHKGGGAPLKTGPGRVDLLIPVDSFASLFGKNGAGEGKRTDLLAIHLAMPGNGSSRLGISACGVESKLVTGTFGRSRAQSALAQARQTLEDFKKLVSGSLSEGGMPERLALADILNFGLRIISPGEPRGIENWVEKERVIYEALLTGNYEYMEAKYKAIVVSTEGQLSGVAEHVALPEGLWVRLTRGHWPGICDTPQLEDIREELRGLFGHGPEEELSAVGAEYGTPTMESTAGESPHAWEPPVTPSSGDPPSAEAASGGKQEEKHSEKENSGSIEKSDHPQLRKIFIGMDEARSEVCFDPKSPVDPLQNMHVMITGSSGTGKTQFLKYLICQIREQGKNCLILDLKNDFARDDTFCRKSNLERIFVNFEGVPFNPLIPYPVQHPATGELFVQCAQYIAGIASVLKQTYGLGVQQQAAVKNAITKAFNSAGIQTEGSIPYREDLVFPDFSNVCEPLRQENVAAYNRLESLFSLGLFREEARYKSFQSLVNRSSVLDLSQIPSDEIKNTIAQLIVLSSHAYYNAQPQTGNIRQFLVFDEAHRVLNSAYMHRLVREGRAYGVGTIMSSQYPSDFPSDISSSVATKIAYSNGREAERIKGIVRLLGCEGREGEIANLEPFQAIVENQHHPHTLIRAMNYPLFLVWLKLRELEKASRSELSQAEGLDTTKLSVKNLVRQLERLGLAEERDGQVLLVGN